MDQSIFGDVGRVIKDGIHTGLSNYNHPPPPSAIEGETVELDLNELQRLCETPLPTTIQYPQSIKSYFKPSELMVWLNSRIQISNAVPSLIAALTAAETERDELREELRIARLERDSILRNGFGFAGAPDFIGDR